MTRNTKNTWKTSSHIMGTPVGYLKYFSVKKGRDLLRYSRNYAWYLAITRRRETIMYWIRQEASKGANMEQLGESKTEVLQYFLNWDEKKSRKNGRQKDDTVFVEALEKVGVFQRLRSMTSAGPQGPQYVKLQFSRHHRQLRSRYELSLECTARSACAGSYPP
ncbi:CBK_G0022980.mRNA.1.CDS.1 [Saccharomyces cerevisiae]|nr:CBK_G0022980.mRNA.1.CDS.1 [Saccharomyces cerevisiae]CAI7325355.1 CBK_G0022980.mRNA.1.CDS.1 [Saccharomyces cerevisiae]